MPAQFSALSVAVINIFFCTLERGFCENDLPIISTWWSTKPEATSQNGSEVSAEEPQLMSTNEPFRVYWNVPTMQCHKYGMNFSEVSDYGMLQNRNDDFRGNKIALLYDPGEFPALLRGGSEPVKRNGGVPQAGDLQRHLDLFEKFVVSRLMPDTSFSGIGVIDFEHWRPIFSQNFGSLEDYKTVSTDLVHQQHPFWHGEDVEREATKQFEKAARDFMFNTIKLARKLRPKAKWGYYGFPLCFNFTPHNKKAKCKPSIIKENDRIQWLFGASGAIFPSLYYKKGGLSTDQRAEFMAGRVVEAIRVAENKPVIPYTWLKYYDQTNEFVSKTDFLNSIRVPKKHGAAGIIIWGSSNDVNTEKKCQLMRDFLETVAGPIAKQYLQ